MFIIDSHKPERFEFGKLVEEIVNDDNDLVKETITLSLIVQIREVLDLKKRALRDRAWFFGIKACFTTGENLHIAIERELSFYKTQFNLDDNSLSNSSEQYEQYELWKNEVLEIENKMMSERKLRKLLDSYVFEFEKKFKCAITWAVDCIGEFHLKAQEFTVLNTVPK